MSAISLEDRFAIIDLCSVYNYAVDQGDGPAWAGTFTPDGIFSGPAGHSEGRDALIAFGDGFAEQFPRRDALHRQPTSSTWSAREVHHKCFLDFKIPSTDGSVTTMLLGYEDVIVQHEGEWRFKRRDVVSVTGFGA